ncbi:hypothetical protein K1T71_014552 [Dendrolimus kikuchii]|uniref:Uncharacterized protein n=1 Tax=Dendrolimus kikuchii TaxID=765133 RepID=A0ACC1CEH8_9NEOP|nr:hypothetical protein K1T71_014552 [Dendrolimus kikuchii]
MASTSATSGTERSDSESSTTSTDTTPSRSTSYVELESLANAGKAAATNRVNKDATTAAGSNGAAATEVRKRRASVPPPPPRGRKVAEKRPPRPTRAERRRAQAPLPPETAHPQLAPTPADIPQERGGGATLAVPANDPTDRHAPLPQRKKRHRAGRKHRRRAPIAAQEAGPRSSHAQTPAPRANCAHCGQKMPPTAPSFVHRQPAQVAPESDGQQPGRSTRRQQRSELAARPVAPAQPKQQPWEFQPLPQRQPRSRTRRTATPAAPTTTTAGGIDARDPLQIILQRLDRMEKFCGALTELISTIATRGDLKVAAIRILPRVTTNP